MNQHGIYDGDLAQRQAAVTLLAIDYVQTLWCQFVLFQLATED
ncbi:hypothetical protein [Pseudomonas veronii]|nr:hypothetical protein [Pseudomonas veronii]